MMLDRPLVIILSIVSIIVVVTAATIVIIYAFKTIYLEDGPKSSKKRARKGTPLPTPEDEFKEALEEGLNEKLKSDTVVLEWNIERYSVCNGKKTILNDIAGRTQGGDFIALMGPSGCGKTSLLQCLSLRNRHFEGDILVNGQPPGGEYLTASAFVHQSEMLFGFMTVREHLLFQAVARMSRVSTYEEILARVEEVISDARLGKCADTLIGGNDPTFRQRGISGGEYKRVGIATELLHCPDIIFLDEPTSGLDSVIAEAVIVVLSDLAQRGRIVMSVVHCPSSELVDHFTHFLLLTSDGRLAFHGPRERVVSHFEALGYPFPISFNPADVLLRISSCPPESDMQYEVERFDAIVEAFKTSEWSIKCPLPRRDGHKRFQRVRGLGASSWTLFTINCWRFILSVWRWVWTKNDTVPGIASSWDKATFCVWVVLNGVVGIMIGLLFLDQARQNWRNLMGLVFALTTSALVIGSMSNVVRFPLEWGPVSREYFAGSNAIGPYLLARYCQIIPYLLGPVALVTAAYWMGGLDPSLLAFAEFVGVYMGCMLCSVALGQLASSLSHNILAGVAILPVFLTPTMLFCGLLYSRNTLPDWLSWVENLSIVNFTFAALVLQQRTILSQFESMLMLKFLQLDPADMVDDVMMIWILFAGIGLLNYVALSVRMRFTTDFT